MLSFLFLPLPHIHRLHITTIRKNSLFFNFSSFSAFSTSFSSRTTGTETWRPPRPASLGRVRRAPDAGTSKKAGHAPGAGAACVAYSYGDEGGDGRGPAGYTRLIGIGNQRDEGRSDFLVHRSTRHSSLPVALQNGKPTVVRINPIAIVGNTILDVASRRVGRLEPTQCVALAQ